MAGVRWCPMKTAPCVAAFLRIDKHGTLLSKHFKRALMRSHARLTYEQVQAARDGRADETTAPLCDNVIASLYGAFAVLNAARERRGALELDMEERRILLGRRRQRHGRCAACALWTVISLLKSSWS